MSVSRQQLEAILKRQKYRCYLTGRPLDPSNVSCDHLVPLSRGGSQDASNMRLVTRQANHSKANLLLEEFVQLCQDVVAEDRKRKRRKVKTKRRRGRPKANPVLAEFVQQCRDVVAEDRKRKRRKGKTESP